MAIKQQTDLSAFLARGGTVTRVSEGVCGEYVPSEREQERGGMTDAAEWERRKDGRISRSERRYYGDD